MEPSAKILIVGAGPAGLAAALFLADNGIPTRVIDQKAQPSQTSKALGVNPRTLQLLQNSGLTKRFLANGRKMEKINLWQGDEQIFQNDLTRIPHPYPFMLIQPQSESEHLLLEALADRKIDVEFGTTCQSLQQTNGNVETQLWLPAGKTTRENFTCLIGADGGRSTVRRQVGIDLAGFRDEEEWTLYDLELATSLALDEGHIRLFREGGMIMIRLKGNCWRVAGNLPGLLNYLPKHTRPGAIVWESKFRIQHRLAENLVRDRVVLIGDAAHQHSPVGARGMNLGLEDGYWVSKLIAEGKLPAYHSLRHGYLRRTVSQINRMTQFMAGHGTVQRILRSHLSLFRFLLPLAAPTATKFILGLNK